MCNCSAGAQFSQMMTAQRAARPTLVTSRSGTPRSTGAPLSESTLHTSDALSAEWPRVGRRRRPRVSFRHVAQAGGLGVARWVCAGACCRRRCRVNRLRMSKGRPWEQVRSAHGRNARVARPSPELQRMQHTRSTGQVQTAHAVSVSVKCAAQLEQCFGPRGQLEHCPQYEGAAISPQILIGHTRSSK